MADSVQRISDDWLHRLAGSRAEVTATTLLAAMLEAWPRFRERVLLETGIPGDHVSASYEVKAEEWTESRDGRADIVLTSPNVSILIEAKFHAEISIEQLERYSTELSKKSHQPGATHLVLLVPKNRRGPATSTLQKVRHDSVHLITWESIEGALQAAGPGDELLKSLYIGLTTRARGKSIDNLTGDDFSQALTVSGELTRRDIVSGLAELDVLPRSKKSSGKNDWYGWYVASERGTNIGFWGYVRHARYFPGHPGSAEWVFVLAVDGRSSLEMPFSTGPYIESLPPSRIIWHDSPILDRVWKIDLRAMSSDISNAQEENFEGFRKGLLPAIGDSMFWARLGGAAD